MSSHCSKASFKILEIFRCRKISLNQKHTQSKLHSFKPYSVIIINHNLWLILSLEHHPNISSRSARLASTRSRSWQPAEEVERLQRKKKMNILWKQLLSFPPSEKKNFFFKSLNFFNAR